MEMFRGLIGGLIAGVVGAAVWAGITYGTGYEIGWIAWGIGLVCGLGVALGWRGGGAMAGLLAVVISLVSICGGKYATVQLIINKEVGTTETILEAATRTLDDEVLTSYIADEVVLEYERAGRALNWPAGADREVPSEASDYPQDVWAEAAIRFNRMTPEEHQEFRAGVIDEIRQSIEVVRAEAASYGFTESFGVMDIVFFLLAVITAFKVGAGGGTAEA